MTSDELVVGDEYYLDGELPGGVAYQVRLGKFEGESGEGFLYFEHGSLTSLHPNIHRMP